MSLVVNIIGAVALAVCAGVFLFLVVRDARRGFRGPTPEEREKMNRTYEKIGRRMKGRDGWE